MKMKIYIILVLAVFFLSGCGSSNGGQNDADMKNEYIYYVNMEENGTGQIDVSDFKNADLPGSDVIYRVSASDGQEVDGLVLDKITRYLYLLSVDPEDAALKRILGQSLNILSVEYKGGQVVVDFDEDYYKLQRILEILFRSTIVRTLCQIDGVESVIFTVKGQALENSEKRPYGSMGAESFIDSTDREMNAYDRCTVTLYFSNKTGTALVPVKEEIVYPGNMPLEKLVLEKLLSGPVDEEYRATLFSDRRVNSVNVKDGTCYVDLSSSTFDMADAVSEELTLYSIVNTLTGINGINKVQLSVDGNKDGYFRGVYSLSEVYERNLEVVEDE